MSAVYRSGRVKVGGAVQTVAILQHDALASAVEDFGEAGVLILVNRGLKSALGRVIQAAVANGEDPTAAQLAYVPTSKTRTAKGIRTKGPARMAREAIKSGAISKEELASFLASRGVTA